MKEKLREILLELAGYMTAVKFEGMTSEIGGQIARAEAAILELMPRWIPVTERLPEDESDKLVYTSRGRYRIKHYINHKITPWDYEIYGWEKDDCQKFIIATEEGILHEMKKRAPHKELIPALVFDESCNCSECFFMKRNTLEKLYLCMKYEVS